MLKSNLSKILSFLLNPRFVLCFGIGWVITNGWAYTLFAAGTYFDIGWMKAVSGAYLAFLWVPFTPEKLITLTIAIALLKFLFPNDERTLAVLRRLRKKAQKAIKNRKKYKSFENDEDYKDV